MQFSSQEIRPFSIRKEIFSQYRLPDDPIKIQQRKQISKDKKSSNQVLLKQIGLFKFNISAVLSQKNDLIKKLQRFDNDIRKVYRFIAEFNQGDIAGGEQIERKFNSIWQLRNQSQMMQNQRSSTIRKSKRELQKFEHSNYLMKALVIYKGLLNYGESLKFQGESFRLGTLSNFNPKYTQVKFTKVPLQSENAVMRYVNKIIEQSSKAMESKVRYENNYQKDRFLLQEDKYVPCWKSLQQLYSPKQVQLINFEMLNILDSFDKDFDRFKQTLRSHGENCKRYQGVMDSMDLMGRQIEEMTHTVQSRDEIISNFVTLSQKDPQQMQRILIKCEEQQKLIEKNLKIYHINEKLFASYNTETNLNQYSRQRNNFSTKLNQLENRLGKWDYEFTALRQIVESYNTADDIINKRIINPKRIGLSKSSSDFDRILLRIEEVNTRKNKNLNILKNNILSILQQRATNPNSQNSVSSVRRVSQRDDNFPQDQILQKQKSFLSNLQRIPDFEKKRFLIEHYEKIKQYMEYNSRKRQDNRMSSSLKDRLKIFEGKLSILNEITKNTIQMRKMQISRQQSSSDNFEAYIRQHMTTLEKLINSFSKQYNISQDELAYEHTHDYSLFEHLFQSQTWFQMTRILQKLQGSFISRPVSFSSNTKIQALKELISFTKAFVKEKYPQLTINMLEIFSQTLFQMTNGLSAQLYHFQDFYWQKMTSTVTIFYQKNNYEFQENNSRDKTIDKSSFFTLPYLIHLNRTSNKNKVLNLDEIFTKIVKMMYDHLSNLRQHQIFQYAVCLTYLIRYIRNVCPSDQVQIKVLILSKLRRLLTSHILKSQFMKIYDIEQKNHKEISNKMIQDILGLQCYLCFTDNFISNREKITQFEIENNKYLKGIQQQMKVLVINLSGPYSAEFNLQKISFFWSFQNWLVDLKQFLSYSDSTRNISIASQLLVLRKDYETLSKIVESIDWNSIKQSDGFLIRMIRKENFYLKRQFNKFKTLQKENVWKQYPQILDHLIKEIESQNSLRNGAKKQAINVLNQLQLKKNKALMNNDKKYV